MNDGPAWPRPSKERRGNNTCLIGENRVHATLSRSVCRWSRSVSCSINRRMEKRRPLLSRPTRIVVVVRGFPSDALLLLLDDEDKVGGGDAARMTPTTQLQRAAVILFCSAGVLIAISQACASRDRGRRRRTEGKTLPPPAATPANDWVGQGGRQPGI